MCRLSKTRSLRSTASGRLLTRTEQLFFNLTASETSPQLQAVERDFAPKLAAHENAILLNQKLFARIDELYARRAALSLSVEQMRLLERVHLDSVLAGARLSAEAKNEIERACTTARTTSDIVFAERTG